MSNQEPTKEPLLEEFQAFGKNLIEVMRAAWDSPERRRLQDDIENGLAEFGKTIRQEADDLSNTRTGQQLKQDFDQLGKKITTSEAPEKIRMELIKALQSANSELNKIIDQWKSSEENTSEPISNEPDQDQEQPDS